MLDIGWPELLIIALVTIIVVGPKEIPRVLRTVTQVLRKVRSMASEFQSSIDDLAREAELDDLKKDIEKVASTDIAGELEREIDPSGEVNKSVREIETSLKEDPRKQPSATRSSPPKKNESSTVATELVQERPDGDNAGSATPASSKKKAGGRA